MMDKIKISGNRFIGKGFPTYIIAEIGINHNGSLDIAKELIEYAAKAGVDAVKFQKRTLNEMYRKDFLSMPYANSNSFGKTYGEHKKYLEFTDAEFLELNNFTNDHKIDFLISGFDFSGFDFINNIIGVPLHKLPSPLVTHPPLLRHIARYQKPIVLSTGIL